MIPIVLGVAAVGASITGIAKGAEGINNINEAKELGKKAEKLYQEHVDALKSHHERVEEIAELYRRLNLRVRRNVISRFIEFVERTGRKISQGDQWILEEIEGGVTVKELQAFKVLVFEAEEILKLVAEAGRAGYVAGSSTANVASAVGTVSVPTFFGLFTKSVAVSEFGLPGVALCLGGGNAVLGGAILGGVTLGPALAVAGFKIAGKGEDALTQAKAYQAEVNESIENIKTARNILAMLEREVRELGRLIRKLESLALECLDELEAEELDVSRDARKYHQTYFIIKALTELLNIREILDDQGNLDPKVVVIKAKYQNLGDL